ncbi:MAG: response regulator transcription factor [Desulfatiglandales bacterium]|nr:response regulator transcription factor [Desulfatiglandales bacterium]
MEVKIFIADDHRVVRDGLRLILEHHPNLRVVGEAGNGIEATNQCINLEPDIVIMDIGMPLLNGIDVTYKILKKIPSTKVIILSMYGDDQTVLASLRAGARGFILKDEAGEEVVKAIVRVMEGNAYLSPQISSILVGDIKRKENGLYKETELPLALTPQEKQVLQLIAEGYTNKKIAELLFISTQTVRSHRKNIMSKLNIHNVAGLTKFALKKGLAGR